MKKRFEGRDEPIVEPELAIIDAHHHMFDRPAARYLMHEIAADVALGHDIRATVYVESHAMMRADGPEALRPVGETEFANGIAAMSASGDYGRCRVNAGIVSFADLALGAAVGETLDAHAVAGGGRFRGIRQVTLYSRNPEPYRYMFAPPPPGVMTAATFREGFAELGPRGLTFDAAVFHTQLDEVMALADAFPDTTIVLDHMGFPLAMGMDEGGRAGVFAEWSATLREVARRGNIVTKVGGLGMPFWGFGFDGRDEVVTSDALAAAWRPYVETGIEVFGPDRCMMESNFPADGHSCGYVPLWNALKKITAGCSAQDKAALYSGTAARVYRLDVDLG